MIVRDSKGRFTIGTHCSYEFKKGNVCLWKGKTKENCGVLKRISNKLKGRKVGGGSCKGKHWKQSEKGRLSHIGLKSSPEAKEKMKIAKLGNKNPMSKLENRIKVSLGKKGKSIVLPPFTEEHCKNISKVRKKTWLNPEYRRKQELKWLDPVYRRKVLGRRIPTSYEKRLNGLILKYNLPYKYVGDGSVILGTMNPDFIDVNGQKKVVEVYESFYKVKNYKSCKNYEKDRREKLSKFGFGVVFIDGKDLFSVDWEKICVEKLTD